MSGPDRIYARATALTQSPADAFVVDPSALTWLCPVCGKLRVFEGGRPLSHDQHDDCPECGCRLADLDLASLAKCASARSAVGASIGRYLL